MKKSHVYIAYILCAFFVSGCKTVVNCPAPSQELLRPAPHAVKMQAVEPGNVTEEAFRVAGRNGALLNNTSNQLNELLHYLDEVCWNDDGKR